MKVVPLSECIVSVVPLLEVNLLNARKKVSVDKSIDCFKCIARTVAQVNKQIYIFWLCIFLTSMGPS